MSTMRRGIPLAWSAVLAVLLLGPALRPGFVLTYDMVWVPHLAMRQDFLGIGSGLPRAVPSDAVVAVLDQLVGGMILQKLVLLGALIGGGVGALRLAPEESLSARLVAVTLYQWNPFVAERLLIGHWPVLVGYAVLPWLVDAARRWRLEQVMPASIWLLVPLGSLSAGAGIVTVVAVLAFASVRDRRRVLSMAALLLAGNAPWLVAGALHVASATTDPAGAATFALHGEGSLPAPLAALGLGGIWNSEVVPGSRTGALGWVSLVLLLVLVMAGGRRWIARTPRRDAWAFAACWAIGWGGAVLTWAAPGQTAWLYSHVPGAGLFRDGARILALCAPATVVLAAQGAARIVDRLSTVNRPPIALALVLLPVMVLPDLAFGLAGQLRPAHFPKDYALVRAVIAHREAAGQRGDVLVLPLTSYRQPTWNHEQKVLDPIGRYLTPDYLASDVLVVSQTVLSGEDPRVGLARRALDAPTPLARAGELRRLGVRYVVVDDPRPTSPAVAGNNILLGDSLRAQVLDGPARERGVALSSRISLAVAWSLYAGLIVVWAGRLLPICRSRRM